MGSLVGVDIGGTGVRAARVDAAGSASGIRARDLDERSVDEVVDAVVDAARALHADRVGVGVPGFVRDGVVLGSPNFPAWRGVDLAGTLRGRLGVPVVVENDANAAAWGAWEARGRAGDLVMITLGTGVGGGIVSGGRLVRGSGGTGGEVGHIYVGGERRCGCGGVGCLETRSSTVGLMAAAREAGEHVTSGEQVVEAADAGVSWAVAALEDAALSLGRGLVTLVNLLAPDRILVTGGLANAARYLAGPSEAWLRAHGIGPSVERVTVEWQGRADLYAIQGAASLARGADAPLVREL